MHPREALAELEKAGLRPVLEAALARYRRDGELGRSRPDLEPQDWDALLRLTGGQTRTLDLAALDTALREKRYQIGLPELLEALNGGPIVVRRQTRLDRGAAYSALLAELPDAEWRAALENGEAGAGLLRRMLGEVDLAGTLRLVARALDALRGTRAKRLPVLAASLVGDAHALDSNRPAGQLLEAACTALGLEPPQRDGVSSSVLVANLRGESWLEAACGRALWLPWREVASLGEVSALGNRLWIVENPAIFEALLDAVGGSATLLCTYGQPSVACMDLLSKLDVDGEAWVSCDLDLGGLRIAARLARALGSQFRPWRMNAVDLELALERSSGVPVGPEVVGQADLFPDLVASLCRGRGAHQESLLPELVEDVKGT